MKKSVSNIDEWILIDVGISYPISPGVVVQWDVVVHVALIF